MKTDTNQPDLYESFKLSRDELIGLDTAPEYPSPISNNLDAFTSYFAHAQPIIELICRILSMSFGLPSSTILSRMSPESKSGTMLGFMKFPSATTEADRRTSLLSHTDMGTITLLANILGGLQILPPSSEGESATEWVHVKPEPNCLIVNIGDTMVQWTGGVLRSNMHRVTFPPGAQSEHDRYSVVLLCRAAADAKMTRFVGGIVPDAVEEDDEVEDGIVASEWEMKKGIALVQGRNYVRSTGGRPLKGE
jgi:isopenicillin N synthase-like dioxygenase